MGRWKTKLVILMLFYSAGFVTAIYTLAPAPQNTSRYTTEEQKSLAFAAAKSDEFALRFNGKLHEIIGWGKEKAQLGAEMMRSQQQ